MKRFGRDPRLAWAIALAAVALWVATAPATLGSLLPQFADDASSGELSSAGIEPEAPIAAPTKEPTEDIAVEPFPTFPPIPTMLPLPTAAPRTPSSPAGEGMFTLCGVPDPKAEQEIAQIIDGRSFQARLKSRPDGCADLSITTMSRQAGNVTGRQSMNLTVSAGSTGGGPARSVSIQIVTENGVTRVSIGAGK